MANTAGINYDPAIAVAKATSALLAMTAFDTANARLSFNAPASGKVLVRIRTTLSGATTFPSILLGVLNGATIVGRKSPVGAISGSAVASTNVPQEIMFVVTGLSGAYNWDVAYAVQVLLGSTNIHYGGPNNTTANDAWGGLIFEVWDATTLLAGKLYDPAAAVSKATTAALAMTAIDTTNLRLTFTAPASGNVLVRLGGVLHGATTFPQILLGILDGATVRGRSQPLGGLKATALATAQLAVEACFLITGLTPSNSYTWDAAYGVETGITSTGLKYGGPDNASGNNAFGGFTFEIWPA